MLRVMVVMLVGLALQACAAPEGGPPPGEVAYGQAWCNVYAPGANWQYCAAASLADDRACRQGSGDTDFPAYHKCRVAALWDRAAAPWDTAVAAPCRLPDGTMVRNSAVSCRVQTEAYMKE